MEIKISVLKQAIDMILKHVSEKLEADATNIPAQEYWDVKGAARYGPIDNNHPPDQVAGDLIEDWKAVEAMVAGNDPKGQEPYLIEISNVLRALGDHWAEILEGLPK